MRNQHKENHRTGRINWLRAAVLGANDGIISTASLIMGVAAAQNTPDVILTAGVAGLVAGAMSMAAGEYVSVSSQSDTEKADLLREGREIEKDEEYERMELANIYIERGIDSNLAKEVAKQLMDKDSLGAHAREELGISSTLRAKPVQAALASSGAFSLGAIMPILVIIISSGHSLIPTVAGTSLFFLGVLGGVAAFIGGANVAVATRRVMFWGLLAMGFTAAIGSLFGNI